MMMIEFGPERSTTLKTDRSPVQVHLVNPSHASYGIAVMTPRWLYVLAGATPDSYGRPHVVDEMIEPLDPESIAAGDVVGIGIHTANALRGYEVGRLARARGAWVAYGGIHATLYPSEAYELGGAHAVVSGDGDMVWSDVLADCAKGAPQAAYQGGRIEGAAFVKARWDLLPRERYMWPTVQTVRGCPKHCSFCSVWRTDGQRPRQRSSDAVLEEITELRRMGFKFIGLADDNFYPVTLQDLEMADRRADKTRLHELQAIRAERFDLLHRLARLPKDMSFFTQITMEVADDPEFLAAMSQARVRGALIGVESVTPDGLKDIHKGFNASGEALVARLQTIRQAGVHVLGSFIFGLPSDRAATFDIAADIADRSGITFAQFLVLTPFPGTLDFAKWEEAMANDPTRVGGVPITRHWLIPPALRPHVHVAHGTMSPDEISRRTLDLWRRFFSASAIWRRSNCLKSYRARLAFTLISALYRSRYANSGIATDSARTRRPKPWAQWLGKHCRRVFVGAPMPDLEVPE